MVTGVPEAGGRAGRHTPRPRVTMAAAEAARRLQETAEGNRRRGLAATDTGHWPSGARNTIRLAAASTRSLRALCTVSLPYLQSYIQPARRRQQGASGHRHKGDVAELGSLRRLTSWVDKFGCRCECRCQIRAAARFCF
jgi:hypothetical protein